MSAVSNVPASDLLRDPGPRGHYVQLYHGAVLPLLRNVARYLSEGIARGEGTIAIVTPEHLAVTIRTPLSMPSAARCRDGPFRIHGG